jgi:HEAT repeat protein
LLRANAIEGLHHAPTRLAPIVAAGLRDENLGVRYAAAVTVGELSLNELTASVRPLLHDPDERVRLAAISALVQLGQEVDRQPLGDALHSGEPRLAAHAAFLLGELGDASAIPMLKSVSARPPARGSRSGGDAGRGGGTRGDTDGAVTPQAPPEPVGTPDPIERVLLRLQVAEAIIKLGDDSVRHVLHAALYPRHREDFEAAVLAAQILGELDDRTAVSQLVQLVEQATPETREESDPRRRVFIQPPEVRLAAATSLAKMGFPDGVYVAEQYRASAQPALRSQSAFLYGAVGDVRALARLETMLQADASAMVRVAAAAATLEAMASRR